MFLTTLDELRQEPNSLLAMLFNGKFKLPIDPETKAVLLSRNGDVFAYILSWLRDGVVPHDLPPSEVSVLINFCSIVTAFFFCSMHYWSRKLNIGDSIDWSRLLAMQTLCRRVDQKVAVDSRKQNFFIICKRHCSVKIAF